MSPDKKKLVCGHKITQYYWSGKDVVYLDNRAVPDKYDTITPDTIEDVIARMVVGRTE